MKTTKLGSLLTVQHGYAFKSSNYVEKSRFRLVTLGNFEEGNNSFKYNDQKATYYGADFPNEFILHEGDLIMPLTEQVVGLFGNTAFVPKEDRFTFVLNQRVGRIVCDESKIDKNFLHYLLATKSVKDQLEARSSGTRQRNISPNDIYDVEVSIPSITAQKAIGKLLFDIENRMIQNNSICSDLEAMAKLLYDYWFVQFDFPDENGKPYKSSGGKMVWNDELKREIPEGWAVKPTLDIFDWVGTSQPPKSTFAYESKEGYIRFIQNRDYDGDKHITYIPLTSGTRTCTELDIMIDKYGDAGKTRFGIAGAYNVALSKVVPQDEIMREYVRAYLSSDTIYNYLHSACIASTRASLNESNFDFLSIAIPDNDTLQKFNDFAKQIIIKQLEIKAENQQLTSLRDFLLPMLINGQVKVGKVGA